MMKETQWQNRMRRSSLMPQEHGEQNDSGPNGRGLHPSDLSLAQIAQRPAALSSRIKNSKQNRRKGRNGSPPDALDGASADELHHRARDGAESAPDRERDNANEIRAPASPSIRPRSPDRHRYRRGEH